MKKMIHVFLLLIFLITIVTSEESAQFNQIKTNDGVISTETFSMKDNTNYEVNGQTLTIKGIGRMNDCDMIKSFDSFDPLTIETIVIENSVESIGRRCFQLTRNVKSITFNEGIKSIGEGAFYGTKLTQIAFPASLETIKKSAFEMCEKIEEVSFAEGSSLKTIDIDAFRGCKGMKRFSIPKSYSIVNFDVFEQFEKLEEIVFEEGHEKYETKKGMVIDKQDKTIVFVHMELN